MAGPKIGMEQNHSIGLLAFGCLVGATIGFQHYHFDDDENHNFIKQVFSPRKLPKQRQVVDDTPFNPNVVIDCPGSSRRLLDSTISAITLHELTSLRNIFESADIPNNIGFQTKRPKAYNKEFGAEDFIIQDIVRKQSGGNDKSEAFVRSGPRSTSHFQPSKVRAAIVTCGGLCPGLNNVVRELVRALFHLYGVESVTGIRGGWNGFLGSKDFPPIPLTCASVADCHHQGGTILGTSRGGFDEDSIISFLTSNGINQLYVIGGDGTHRGADKLAQACIERKLNIAVVGIPKTIDNDVDLIDRSFGFTTSVEAAQQAILSAKTEAKCNMPNGVGIVKLMGRSAGFIAVHAVMASGDVDLCLVPEVDIELEGPNGCLPFLLQRVREQVNSK